MDAVRPYRYVYPDHIISTFRYTESGHAQLIF